MEMNKKFQNTGFKRIMITAPKSGSGKTLITAGLMKSFIKTGYNICGAKCGPDYIDPMYHRMITNKLSVNLDSYFVGEGEQLGNILKQAIFFSNADCCIIEGAMGFYDGIGGISTTGSAYEISELTQTPVVLVVDAKGASVSLAATIKGMLEFRKNHICGVILNRCSQAYYDRLKELIEYECDIQVFGFLPEIKKLVMPSRHLGLVAPGELDDTLEWVDTLSEAIDEYVDIEAVYNAAAQYDIDEMKFDEEELPQKTSAKAASDGGIADDKLCIAVARDEAFSFYYEENIRFLEKCGAKIIYFSPLHDEKLPEGISGMLLGGGYPELYAKKLSENAVMRKQIRDMLRSGLPFLAECGGFLYLQKHLEDINGKKYEMAGFFDGEGIKTNRLVRFGYAELEFLNAGCFGEAGCKLRVHEFHHWDCSSNGDAAIARKANKEEYNCMHYTDHYAAGFPHFYFENNPQAIRSWLNVCRNAVRK